jgi:hypothetical protein
MLLPRAVPVPPKFILLLFRLAKSEKILAKNILVLPWLTLSLVGVSSLQIEENDVLSTLISIYIL